MRLLVSPSNPTLLLCLTVADLGLRSSIALREVLVWCLRGESYYLVQAGLTLAALLSQLQSAGLQADPAAPSSRFHIAFCCWGHLHVLNA